MERHIRGARSATLVLCISLGCLQVLAVVSSLFWIAAAYDKGNQPAAQRGSNRDSTNDPRLVLANPSPSFRPATRVYPYSIIPGGIESVEELKAAAANDRMVAAHYQDEGFDLAKAQVIRLHRERQVYVSYRRGEKAYWTTRKIKLNVGEALITDGRHTARARCGNLISDVPASPTFAGEPTPSVLDTLLDSGDPIIPGMVATFVPQQSMESASPGVPVFVSVLPVFPVDPSIGPLPSPGPPPGPPTVVPEPATLILVSAGLSSMCIFRKR
ncbi:MAG TPA: PEP-CTERM sorting domain-containing protein [Candidatus Dormibacteraeota bacterium]|nr:PEP-CTERM sorting domain-containing protein [Candidatus Dormibacteraeota bacterium]